MYYTAKLINPVYIATKLYQEHKKGNLLSLLLEGSAWQQSSSTAFFFCQGVEFLHSIGSLFKDVSRPASFLTEDNNQD